VAKKRQKKQAPAPDLSEAEIEQFLAADAKRLEKQREVDALEREAKPFKDKIKAYVVDRGGADRTCVHFGYVLALMPAGADVKWKDEFIAIAGHQAAVKLQNEAPQKLRLKVEPAAAT
jgi:hypothetical protein